MRKFFCLIFVFSAVLCSAQQFNIVDGGLEFSDAKGTSLNKALFEECWCYPVYHDSTKQIKKLIPNVYPVPVKLGNSWMLLSKDGTIMGAQKSTVPYLKIQKGIAELNNFKLNNHLWSCDSSSFILVKDSTFKELKKYQVQDIYKGTFLASEDNYFWGLLDSKLATVVKFEYTSAHHLGEDFQFSSKGFLTLRENKPEGYNGIVDYTGKTHVTFKWKLLPYIPEDLEHIYAMNENLKRGYINIKGETVFPFIFDRIPREVTDSNFVETKDYVWFVDKDLKQIGVKYQSLEKKGKVWFYKKDNKWGIMDAQYKSIIPNIY